MPGRIGIHKTVLQQAEFNAILQLIWCARGKSGVGIWQTGSPTLATTRVIKSAHTRMRSHYDPQGKWQATAAQNRWRWKVELPRRTNEERKRHNPVRVIKIYSTKVSMAAINLCTAMLFMKIQDENMGANDHSDSLKTTEQNTKEGSWISPHTLYVSSIIIDTRVAFDPVDHGIMRNWPSLNDVTGKFIMSPTSACG